MPGESRTRAIRRSSRSRRDLRAKFRGWCESLAAAKVELSAEQEEIFRDNFSLLETQLHTPRQCKRYANGVTIAIRILRGEVNPVDLLLIEALRIFQPRLYEVIRSHREFFISGGQPESSLGSQQFERR
jgi:predicted KAP-like P-loop ATPase